MVCCEACMLRAERGSTDLHNRAQIIDVSILSVTRKNQNFWKKSQANKEREEGIGGEGRTE
eukprot:scaffold3357_cov268-Chaetoceros_neogracile.AAC.24